MVMEHNVKLSLRVSWVAKHPPIECTIGIIHPKVVLTIFSLPFTAHHIKVTIGAEKMLVKS